MLNYFDRSTEGKAYPHRLKIYFGFKLVESVDMGNVSGEAMLEAQQQEEYITYTLYSKQPFLLISDKKCCFTFEGEMYVIQHFEERHGLLDQLSFKIWKIIDQKQVVPVNESMVMNEYADSGLPTKIIGAIMHDEQTLIIIDSSFSLPEAIERINKDVRPKHQKDPGLS